MSTPGSTPAESDAAAELDVDPAGVDEETLPDDAGDDPESLAGGRMELPLEADPADVAEQDAPVPYDDDLR
jgi:hypothetical protein